MTVAASPGSSIATSLESETGDSTCYEAKQEVNGVKQDELQRDEKSEEFKGQEDIGVCYDIGEIIAQCELEDNVARKLRSLSASQKYALLKQHSQLPERFFSDKICWRIVGTIV